jgi:hypothetical protein
MALMLARAWMASYIWKKNASLLLYIGSQGKLKVPVHARWASDTDQEVASRWHWGARWAVQWWYNWWYNDGMYNDGTIIDGTELCRADRRQDASQACKWHCNSNKWLQRVLSRSVKWCCSAASGNAVFMDMEAGRQRTTQCTMHAMLECIIIAIAFLTEFIHALASMPSAPRLSEADSKTSTTGVPCLYALRMNVYAASMPSAPGLSAGGLKNINTDRSTNWSTMLICIAN